LPIHTAPWSSNARVSEPTAISFDPSTTRPLIRCRPFERLGAPLWAERARAELARIGGRRSVAGKITEAEARVAKLAAAGRTNREIANALFMSVRTVEGHLLHAYAKLGVRSRTELALFFDETEQSPHP
jgi:DNA-binding CsgD family transcriptional regulator